MAFPITFRSSVTDFEHIEQYAQRFFFLNLILKSLLISSIFDVTSLHGYTLMWLQSWLVCVPWRLSFVMSVSRNKPGWTLLMNELTSITNVVASDEIDACLLLLANTVGGCVDYIHPNIPRSLEQFDYRKRYRSVCQCPNVSNAGELRFYWLAI